MHAAFHGHADIVKLLLEKGANVNSIGKGGVTALRIAEQRGHAHIVDILRAAGGKRYTENI